MTKKQKALLAVEALKNKYPDAICSLEYQKPHELLIATRLSAQCTDARVNIITPALFARFESIDAFAEADLSEVEQMVRSCGFYKTKAHDIIAMCRMLREQYNYTLPDTVEELIKLPGVGRKTASVVLAVAFKIPAMPVDTHVFRVSKRLHLTNGNNPEAVEEDLRRVFKKDDWIDAHHLLLFHGRYICKAQKPICEKCNLVDECPERRI